MIEPLKFTDLGSFSDFATMEIDRLNKKIETLETALREIKGWNDSQNKRSLKIAAVVDAALAGEKKDGQAE